MGKYHFTKSDKMEFANIESLTAPLFSTNIITSNVTAPDGNVHNESEDNADFAKKWVDENHK